MEAVLGQLVDGRLDHRAADDARRPAAARRRRGTGAASYVALNEAAVVRGSQARVVRAGGQRRRLPRGDLDRRRPGGQLADGLDRLLLQRRRPDPGPDQPQPRGHAHRGVPVRHPDVRGRARARGDGAGRGRLRLPRVSIDGREDVPLHVGDEVRVSARERPIRFIEPRGALPFWELLRRKARAAALLRWRCSSSRSPTSRSSSGCGVPLRPGLTVLTGETGAGKSLLIDALLLVQRRPRRRGPGAGGRARRRGWRRCSTVPRARRRCPGAAHLRPRGAAAGRTVARIDDETVPAARLAAAVEPLVEVHGQHEQQRLLVGGAPAGPARRVRRARGRCSRDGRGPRWRRGAPTGTRCASWTSPAAELERRLELARHAVDEIEAVGPARVRSRSCARGSPWWPARSAIRAASRHAAERARWARQAAPGTSSPRALARRARAGAPGRAAGGARDAAGGPRGRGRRRRGRGPARRPTSREADRARQPQLEERLGSLYGLLRKYGETEEAVLAHAGGAPRRGRRASAASDAERRRRERGGRRACGTAADGGRRGSSARRAPSAAAIARAAPSRASCRDLGFPDAAFDVQVDAARRSMRRAPTTVAFLLAPNPGEPARPLARIASGGELSRVALAIEQVLAAADDDRHARVRRGGRGHRRPLGRSGRPQPVAAGAPPPGAVRDAPARRSRRTRTPISTSRSRSSDGRTVTAHRASWTGDERVAELAAMLGGRREPAPRTTRRASCCERRRRRGHAAAGIDAGDADGRRRSTRALETYLDHLRVERGLSAATIRAYDTDLRAFAARRPASSAGRPSPERRACAASPPWAARPRRCGRHRIRRKAAAIRAFYRLLLRARSSSTVDVADASWTCRAAGRWRCPRRWTWTRWRRCSRRPTPDDARGHPRPGAAGAAVRVRAARQRGARARPGGPVDRRRVRAGHRQGRPGAGRAGG